MKSLEKVCADLTRGMNGKNQHACIPRHETHYKKYLVLKVNPFDYDVFILLLLLFSFLF